jgi:hypothetical protein
MVLDSDSGMKRARMVVEPPANVDVDIDKKLSCASSEMTGKGLEPRSTSRSHICGRSLKMASEVPAIQSTSRFWVSKWDHRDQLNFSVRQLLTSHPSSLDTLHSCHIHQPYRS